MTGSGNRFGPRVPRAALPVLFAAVLAFVLPASASAGEFFVKKRESGAAGKNAIADYWTDRKVADARPLELYRKDDGELDVRLGKEADEDEETTYNHPVDFESGVVENPSTPPNTVNGKLLGKIKGLGAYECSATVVQAANLNTIITAGHCVAEPSGHNLVATKLAFIPSYAKEARPFGTWVFNRIVALKSWKRNSNFNYDFAAIEMSPQNGVNLQDAVGGAPVATNLPVDMTYYSVGYPMNFGNGQVMRYCLGGFEGFDPRPIPNGPTAISMGCDMSMGASGGGWFVDGYLASVTSFGYQDHPDVAYGPYFGRKSAEVYARGSR